MPFEAEWLTRKKRVSPWLDAAGWPRQERAGSGAYRLEEYDTGAGPADYALCMDSDVLGVVEAKKLSLGPQNVLKQAERYSRSATSNRLRFGDFHVPFLYSTNGEVLWFADVRSPDYRSRKVSGFHTPSAFKEMLAKDFDAACRLLEATPNAHSRLRPYQIEANAAVEAAIAARKREMLVAMIDPATGADSLDVLEDQRQFEPQEVERKVTSPDSNKKIMEALRDHCLQHEERYGRFPKTLIFAAHDIPHTSHADQLVDICRDVFGRGDSFVQKITGRVDRPLQRIREFRNRQQPGIVVSVDLMSTGVDIPDLEIIVFLRPVQSRILFEQMLGAAREGERHPDKSHFTVFDCFGGTLIERFKQATAITAEPPAGPTRTIGQIIDDIWNNRDQDYNVRCLVKRLQRIDKEMSGEARRLFEPFIPAGDVAAFAKGLPAGLASDFTSTMKLLRDQQFQELLVGYPRKKDSFLVAIGTQDTVMTEWLLRDGAGRKIKPADYLAMFAQFVKDNPAKIEAIGILLDRPRDWGTQALSELRTKLAQTRERFTPELLQKAHEVHYRKALVDIISMVKHAASEDQPLLTAAERVERAFAKLTINKEFTTAQQAWLDRIRQHLIENLSIDREDFDDLPIFARHGGWGRANQDFEGRLIAILSQINETLAA